MNRRQWLTALGAGRTVFTAGCGGLLSHFDSADHLVFVVNRRETSYEVTVELEYDGENNEHGPETLEPDERWEVRHFESEGELTVRIFVEGTLRTEETHEIPILDGDRSSATQVELHSENEEVRIELLEEQ